MRPKAIVSFERLYLVSLVLVLVQQVTAFVMFRNMFDRFAGVVGAPSGAGETFGAMMIMATIFGVVLSFGIPLLFWWLAARKRQEFAKWVLLAISILSALNWLFAAVMMFFLPADLAIVPGVGSFQATQTILLTIDAVSEVLGIAGLTYLFRQEAVAWFRTINPAASADVFR